MNQDDDDCDEIEYESPQRKGKRRVRGESHKCLPLLDKVINNLPASPARSPPKRYKSAYRPSAFRPSVSQSGEPPVLYDSFSFTRTTITVNEDASPTRVCGDTEEVILIARDWQKEVGGGESRAGYLGSGLSKFAFKVIE